MVVVIVVGILQSWTRDSCLFILIILTIMTIVTILTLMLSYTF